MIIVKRGPHSGVTFRTDLRPGDLGLLLQLHGDLYAREYGYGLIFEGYVAQSIAEFAHLPQRSGTCLWLAEKGGRIVGSIAIVRRSVTEAQLRWFLVVPEYRGIGLGRELLERALQYCRAQGYQLVYLWTETALKTAGRMYRAFGFVSTEEKAHALWGKSVTEVRYDLEL